MHAHIATQCHGDWFGVRSVSVDRSDVSTPMPIKTSVAAAVLSVRAGGGAQREMARLLGSLAVRLTRSVLVSSELKDETLTPVGGARGCLGERLACLRVEPGPLEEVPAHARNQR